MCKEKKSSQMKLRVETVYNRKSLVLLMKTTGEDLSMHARMER